MIGYIPLLILNLSVKASQVLVVLKNVGFSIPRYEPDPNPRLPGNKNVAPVWVGGPLKNTTSTTPYFNPDAMVHGLLTLNEPLLQRSRPHGPLGLSLTTIKSSGWT